VNQLHRTVAQGPIVLLLVDIRDDLLHPLGGNDLAILVVVLRCRMRDVDPISRQPP
jgi:hypothetical protein